MSQESELPEVTEPAVAAVQWSPAAKSSEEQESILLRGLFDKVSGEDWDKPEQIEKPPEENGTQAAAPPNSQINRLFDKVRSLDSSGELDAMPDSKKPVTRITLHEIKAMKVVAAAEFEPAVVIRQRCNNSLTNFWSSLHQMIHRMFAVKPNC
jgi:hypothetical protein